MSKSSRKILFLAHTQSIHTKRWVEFFIDNGWEVHIISFHPDVIAGAANYYLNVGKISESGNNLKYLRKLHQILLLTYRIRPEIINAHYMTSFGLLAYLTFYRKICLTLQGSDVFVYSIRNRLYRFFSKRMLRRAVHIFSVSNAMTKFICSEFNLDAAKITTIQYGVDTELFRILKPIEERKYTFFTNRAFIQNSNYPLILDVMHRLKSENINYSMQIVGSGPLKEHIKTLLEQYDLLDCVFLNDAVKQEELVGLLNDAKFYISFTSSDGTPLSLFEACACGLYPILSANDANKEWLDKGLKGECVNLADPDELVNSIKRSMRTTDHKLYQSYNSEFVRKNMSYAHNMAVIEKIIASLI